jgi:streptogramin lyase
VAVDQNDDVWVFNRGAHPVIRFDRAGSFKHAWGEGQFRRPHAITVGPDGTLWLTDEGRHTIRSSPPRASCS